VGQDVKNNGVSFRAGALNDFIQGVHKSVVVFGMIEDAL
jgi:hypothetical protein